jgi:hypothetical protein
VNGCGGTGRRDGSVPSGGMGRWVRGSRVNRCIREEERTVEAVRRAGEREVLDGLFVREPRSAPQ